MSRISSLLIAGIVFPSCITAAPSWHRIALNGIEVTALHRGATDEMIVGTVGQGAYRYRNGVAEPILSNDPATDSVMKKRTVHCLAVGENRIVAGTDSGLYIYEPAPSRPPGWKSVPGIPRTAIRALHRPFSSGLFIATDGEVYRTELSGVPTVLKIDTLHIADALPPCCKSAKIRCLTSCRGVIYCGSIWSECNSSWAGILRSNDSGKTWEEFNDGWKGGPMPGIRSLTVYYPRCNSQKPAFLAAAEYSPLNSANDVFFRENESKSWDTAGGLHNKGMRFVYVTYISESDIAVRHAAGEEGVFRDTKGTLVRLGDLTGVNALLADVENNGGPLYDSLFAGAKDGLYLYSDIKTRVERNDALQMRNVREQKGVRFIPFAAADRKNPGWGPFEIFTLQGKRFYAAGFVRQGMAETGSVFPGNPRSPLVIKYNR